MPFEDDYFVKIYLGHILEHLVWERVPEALAEVRRVAKPGAQIMVVGPCIHKAVATKQPDWLFDAIIARPEAEGGLNHAWTPTEAFTFEAMENGGLDNIQVVNIAAVTRPEWPNPSTAPWQCALKATVSKGSSRTGSTPYSSQVAETTRIHPAENRPMPRRNRKLSTLRKISSFRVAGDTVRRFISK
jgi:hypothetical protein